MADNVTANSGSGGATFATDDILGVQYPRSKVVWGVDGTATDTAAGAAALPIQDGGNSITIDGTVGVSGTVAVTDNSGSLTVDAPVATPVFVRLSDGAAAISALPITDNAGSLTVDGTVAVSSVGGTVTVSGTVTANAGTGTMTVDSELPTAAALADAAANPTTPTVGAANLVYNGTTWDRVRGDTTNGLDVDVTRLPALAAGTNNIGDVDVLTLPALPTGSNTIGSVRLTDGTLTATVRDTGTSDSLNVAIVDASGNQITSFGGGTQYTEDAVASTDPVGTVPIMTRRDTPASIVSTNLDAISQQATQYGAAYVQVVSSTGSFVDSFGGGTQYAEDSAHVSGDQVTMAGVVQQSADAALSNDGDRSVLQVDANGYLKVNIKAGAGSGGTAMVDEAAFTEATTSFTPIGGVFNDALVSDPTAGQAAAARITSDRALHINIRNASGTELGVSGAPVRTDPTGTTAQPVTDNAGSLTIDSTQLPAALGQTTKSASFAVTLASDQEGVTSSLEASGTIGALNDAVTLDCKTLGSSSFHVLSGLTGTITFECSNDNSTWNSLTCVNVGTSSLTVGSSSSSFPAIFAGSGGTRYVRARCSAYTSGSCTTVIHASASISSVNNTAVTTDNAAFTDGTNRLQMAGFYFDETAGTSLSENDAAAARIDSKRALVNVIEDATNRGTRATVKAASTAAAATDPALVVAISPNNTVAATQSGTWTVGNASGASAVNIQDGGNSITVDGTVAVSGTVTVTGTVTANAGTGTMTVDTELPAAAALASATANPTVPGVGAFGMVFNGTTWDRLPGTTAGVSIQDGGNSITVDGTVAATQSGTWNIGTLTSITNAVAVTDNSGSLTVDNAGTFAVQAGQAAHDAAVSGNPVRIGGRAATADFTAVQTGDQVDLLATILGKQIVKLDAIPDNTWSYAAAAGGLVNTTGVTAKAAAGAGIRNYIKSVQVINSNASTSTEVVIRDGAAGTTLWRGWAQAGGGGSTQVFDPPLRGTANTLVEIAEITATATAGVLVNLQGFVGAE